MCIFCDIACKPGMSSMIYQDENVVAFNDIHPVAPVHVLIVPRKHISNIYSLEDEDGKCLESVLKAIKEVARKQGVSESGFRVVTNCGENAGQSVPHLHFHLIGGKKLGDNLY